MQEKPTAPTKAALCNANVILIALTQQRKHIFRSQEKSAVPTSANVLASAQKKTTMLTYTNATPTAQEKPAALTWSIVISTTQEKAALLTK